MEPYLVDKVTNYKGTEIRKMYRKVIKTDDIGGSITVERLYAGSCG